MSQKKTLRFIIASYYDSFKTFGAGTDLGAQRFREQENIPRLRGFRHYYVRPGGKYQVKKKGILY